MLTQNSKFLQEEAAMLGTWRLSEEKFDFLVYLKEKTPAIQAAYELFNRRHPNPPSNLKYVEARLVNTSTLEEGRSRSHPMRIPSVRPSSIHFSAPSSSKGWRPQSNHLFPPPTTQAAEGDSPLRSPISDPGDEQEPIEMKPFSDLIVAMATAVNVHTAAQYTLELYTLLQNRTKIKSSNSSSSSDSHSSSARKDEAGDSPENTRRDRDLHSPDFTQNQSPNP